MNLFKIEPTKLNIEKSFYALGTLNNIKIFDCLNELLMDIVIERVMQIDDLMSAFKDNSDVSRLNENAGNGFVELHNETLMLLKRSIEFSEMSCGAFDITIRPLVELWGIGRKGSYIPEDKEISNAMKLVDYRKISIDMEKKHAALKKRGQAIDLGGIAKGYAAEEIKRILLENNVKSALINLGGNILTIGNYNNIQPWKIGIQNPLVPTGEYMGVLTVTDKTVVTSGSNERFFIKNGKRYHHIIDPKTGMPSQKDILSVTAVCDCSTDADALTTSIFVLGPKLGMELVKKLNAEAIFVTESLEVFASEGLKDNFRLLNDNEM